MTVEEADREEDIPEVEEEAQEEDRAGGNRAVEDPVDHSSNSKTEGDRERACSEEWPGRLALCT